ncbi:baseplate assembly protein [Pantoea vagans]|nr:GPW/gp25 family protein [Pantoea vagans]NBB57241.1 baseplate assembly protein [Pantoea vagans]
MTTAKYIGMNRETGGTMTDLDHIRQSVRDILLTPVGTRVMRRQYGSLLSALIDQPQNEVLRLQIMSACYMAILKWEPRVTLTAISFESYINGAMVVELSGNRTDSAQPFSLTVPVS